MSDAATAEKLDESPAEEAPDAPQETTETLKISPPGLNRFGLAAEHIQPWLMNVPQKTLPEQCLEEEFWQHVAMHLSPGDTIIVRPDDMAWKMELHVVNAGHNWAQVAREHFSQFATREELPTVKSIYTTRYAGTTHKWQVLRKGELLKEGIETEALARRAAANHELAARR